MRLPFPRRTWLLVAAAMLWGPSAAGAHRGAMAAGPIASADNGIAAAAADTTALPATGTIPSAPFFLQREREGSWLASDRQLHFAGSLAIAASLRVEGRSRAEAVVGSFAVGVAKEIYDAALKPRRLGRGASRKDLVADLLGALAGVALIAAVDR